MMRRIGEALLVAAIVVAIVISVRMAMSEHFSLRLEYFGK